MTREELQSTLQQPYQRDTWGHALRAVLPGTELFTAAQPVATVGTQARQIHQLGRIRLAGGRNLAALEIVLDPVVDLIRNRVGLRNLVARFIDQAEYHGVLAVFLTENPAYRFTFAASESVFDDAGHVTRIETAPRRYTYTRTIAPARALAAETLKPERTLRRWRSKSITRASPTPVQSDRLPARRTDLAHR